MAHPPTKALFTFERERERDALHPEPKRSEVSEVSQKRNNFIMFEI